MSATAKQRPVTRADIVVRMYSIQDDTEPFGEVEYMEVRKVAERIKQSAFGLSNRVRINVAVSDGREFWFEV